MDDTAMVSRNETSYNLQRVLKRQGNRQRSFQQPFPKGHTLQQLTNNVRRFIVDTNVVNCDDVGMIERAGGAGL